MIGDTDTVPVSAKTKCGLAMSLTSKHSTVRLALTIAISHSPIASSTNTTGTAGLHIYLAWTSTGTVHTCLLLSYGACGPTSSATTVPTWPST